MNTLGNLTATAVVPREESYSMHFGFEGPDGNAFKPGTPVKIGTTGEVALLTGTGAEIAIGYVSIGSKQPYDAPDRVTVNTVFSAEIIGVADGTVTPGDALICSGVNADGIPKFKTATAEQIVCAIAIGSAASATTAAVRVGFLRNPFSLPAA